MGRWQTYSNGSNLVSGSIIFCLVDYLIVAFPFNGRRSANSLFRLTLAQLDRIEPYFPLSHGVPRVDGPRVVPGVILSHPLEEARSGRSADRSEPPYRHLDGGTGPVRFPWNSISKTAIPMRSIFSNTAHHGQYHNPAPHLRRDLKTRHASARIPPAVMRA